MKVSMGRLGRVDVVPACFRRYLVVKGDHMSQDGLGHFELMVLLAVIRVGEGAYGVPIAAALEESGSRRIVLASVYNTLERLEQKGLVASYTGEPTNERGGRSKRHFQITAAGVREVCAAKRALTKLWRGIPALEGGQP